MQYNYNPQQDQCLEYRQIYVQICHYMIILCRGADRQTNANRQTTVTLAAHAPRVNFYADDIMKTTVHCEVHETHTPT